MNQTIPSADDFFSSKNVTQYMAKNKIPSIQETVVILAKEFTNLHLKKAMEEIYENIPCLGSSSDIPSVEEVYYAVYNAYPLTNIK